MIYEVVGPRRVCGYWPGSHLTVDDLADANIDHLIAAGHIVKVSTAQTKKASNDDGAAVEETEQ
jgi:hypothetical protein